MEENESDQNRQTNKNGEVPPKKSHTLRSVVIAVSLFILTAFVFIVWWMFRGPAHGTVHVPAGEVSGEVVQTKLSENRYEGEYFSFSYPEEYGEREPQSDPVSLEKVLLVVDGNISRTIAVTVRDMTGKTLQDIPEYQIRNKVERKKYQREEAMIQGENAIIFFQNNEGYEKTGFITKNGLLYTISVNMRMFAKPEIIERDFSLVSESVRFFD